MPKAKRLPFLQIIPSNPIQGPMGLFPVILDPRRTSTKCPGCKKRLEDMQHCRKMLCNNCRLFMERDVIAAISISHKAFRKMSPEFSDSRGDTGEVQLGTLDPAMPESGTAGNPTEPKNASTVASQGLSHLSSTTATSGLTSKFGKGLGRTLALWPA